MYVLADAGCNPMRDSANVGVHGKGRHACLHVRSGRAAELEAAWAAHAELTSHFLLLRVDDAVAEGAA